MRLFMPPKKWDIRIHDILHSIEKIEAYTTGMSYKEFERDSKTVDAVIRIFEITDRKNLSNNKSIGFLFKT